jgi:hypothetical protein
LTHTVVETLIPEVMQEPMGKIWKENATEFYDLGTSQLFVGTAQQACDHPLNSGLQFSNYNKTFSVVLLAIVDVHYNFIAIDIGSFGKKRDGGILAHSNLGKGSQGSSDSIVSDYELDDRGSIPNRGRGFFF